MTIFGDNSRVIANETADQVLALEAEGVDDFEAYRELVAGEIQRQAYETGDWNRGTPAVGQGSSFADRIEPVEVIFDRIMADAGAARDVIEGTK